MLVRGGKLMVFFLIMCDYRGQKAVKGAIQTMMTTHGSSREFQTALETLNQVARTKEHQFWVWTLGQLRVNPAYQKSQLCMWTSFYLKSRGLSWLGMESLADQSIVVGRHVHGRWVKDQSEAMESLCRYDL